VSRSRVLNISNFQQFTAINVLSDPGHIGGPVVIPNVVRFMPVFTLTNLKVARLVLSMSVPAGYTVTATNAETMRAALVAGANWTALAALMPTTGNLTRVDLQDIRTANNPVISSTGPATPGTSASPALPDEVSLVVTIRTARTGQANRGRFFIPNWATNAIGGAGVASAAAVTAAGGFASNILTAITGQGGTWVLAQPARQAYTGITGTQHPARVAGSLPQAGVVVRDNHWDTQRRRGLK
jgi:hypothetical protein